MKSAGELMPERSIDMVEAKYLCLVVLMTPPVP